MGGWPRAEADLTAVNRFLGAQLFGTYAGVGSAVPQAPADASGGVGGFLDWLGDDTRAIDPQEVDRRLHTEPAILFDDEARDAARRRPSRDRDTPPSLRPCRPKVRGVFGPFLGCRLFRNLGQSR